MQIVFPGWTDCPLRMMHNCNVLVASCSRFKLTARHSRPVTQAPNIWGGGLVFFCLFVCLFLPHVSPRTLCTLIVKFSGLWLVASLTQIRSFLCTFKLIWVHLSSRRRTGRSTWEVFSCIASFCSGCYRVQTMVPGCQKGFSRRGKWWWGTGTDLQGVKDAGVAEENNLCRSLTRLRDDDRVTLNGMWAGSVEVLQD